MMLRLLPAFVLLLALVPGSANAQTGPRETVRCALASTSEVAHVILWIGTVDNQEAVEHAASLCTQMIASGVWTGVRNDVLPSRIGLTAVGSIWLSPVSAINVWSAPDYDSTTAAYDFMETFRLNGFPVYD